MVTKSQRRQGTRNLALKSKKWAAAQGVTDVHACEVLKLKLEHLIVLEALESANLNHGRLVSVIEIAESLSRQDKKRLGKAYAQCLNPSIGKVLELLRARGLIFSLRAENRHRFHGSARVLDSSDTSVPSVRSRRCRVLILVRETVLKLGRAVRNSDILEQAVVSEQASGLTRTHITHDVLSLCETRELTVVGRVRGENKGINLYLPADMDVGGHKPKQPMTWLDEVAQVVEALWTEHVEEAEAVGLRPKPFTTRDVRARIANSPFYSQHNLKKDPQILVNAMRHLAETRTPLLRKIKRRGQKALLWVPAGVSDEDVDFGDFYANDAERVGVAVARAVERHSTPVTVRDVKDEIERDFALQPRGISGLSQALSEAAKETYDMHDGKGRQKHVIRRVYRVGRVGRNSYYYTEDAPRAHAYVGFRQLERKWSDIRAEEQLGGLKAASLRWAAKGRAMLLIYEIKTFLHDLLALLSGAEIDGSTRRSSESLKNCAEEALQLALQWLATSGTDDSHTPRDISVDVPVWTADQLLLVVKPFYPLAQSITETNKFITLMHSCIRRVPNSDYETRFSDNPLKAAEFFFDRTDALIYAAKQWGGPECSLQAMLAGNELGHLRDPRFIFPALGSKSFEIRLAGIACLAFLWSADGNERLRRIAVEDLDSGVRQSALWAFGFGGGEGMHELLRSRGEEDPSPRVREFAREALNSCEGSWWMM